MEQYFCYICGNKLPDRFVAGEICSCCYNEAGFDDDILKSELDKFVEADFVRAGITKRDLMQYKKVPLEIAYQLLRAKWINGGCVWHNKSMKPYNWSLDRAKEQLENYKRSLQK